MGYETISTAKKQTVLGCSIYAKELDAVSPKEWCDLVSDYVTQEKYDSYCSVSLTERRQHGDNLEGFKSHCKDLVKNKSSNIYKASNNSEFSGKFGKDKLIYMEFCQTSNSYIVVACVAFEDLHILVHLKSVRSLWFDAGHHSRTNEVAGMMRDLLNDHE